MVVDLHRTLDRTLGDASDNGLLESIIGHLETGAIGTTVFHDGLYKTLADVE